MSASLTPLARQAQSKYLHRLLCVGCNGMGGDPHAEDCPFCHASPSEWCHQHLCPICKGRGVVCPECRGMRFLTTGAGDMVPTMQATKEHRQMVNTATHHCPKCMHLIAGKATLSTPREDDVIVAYIMDPHNAYWRVRDEQDGLRTQEEELSRQAKPWRKDWRKKRGKFIETTLVELPEPSALVKR
jgi:hypothetical protein